MTTAAALKLPAAITADTWEKLGAALWFAIVQARPVHKATHPIASRPVPRLTNGEVITLLMAWLAAIGVSAARIRELFPLWYQFGAAAYGWNPDNGAFVTSAKQRDAWYPDVLLVELWGACLNLATALDASDAPGPRLDLDGRFDDIVFQGEVKAALKGDGAVIDTRSAHAAFKIPMPACKGKDGRPVAPKCKRVMSAWPYLCEEFDACAPVLVDDPVTVVKDKALSVFQLALLVGAFWVLFDNKKSRRRRTRHG